MSLSSEILITIPPGGFLFRYCCKQAVVNDVNEVDSTVEKSICRDLNRKKLYEYCLRIKLVKLNLATDHIFYDKSFFII